VQTRLFVYGTLRLGESNHRLLARSRLLGLYTTPACYTMYDLGGYPGVLPEGSTAVAGEVYRIIPALMRDLDRLEDYPRLYGRRQIPTPWGLAWIYLLQHRPMRRPRLAGTWRRGKRHPNRPPDHP
jgi:gamma-glutamylaminecyclotransferase